jgi:hypothetical protein
MTEEPDTIPVCEPEVVPSPVEAEKKVEEVSPETAIEQFLKHINKPGEAVVTRDAWEIVTLLTFNHIPIEIHRGKNAAGKSHSIFVFHSGAYEIWQKYVSEQGIPVTDIRDVKRAWYLFKSFTHG